MGPGHRESREAASLVETFHGLLEIKPFEAQCGSVQIRAALALGPAERPALHACVPSSRVRDIEILGAAGAG